MLTPAILVLCGVLLYPAFIAVQSSFYRIRTVTREETFVGLENYRDLLTDSDFWATLWRTIVWVAGAMSTQMVFGIAVALVLHKKFKGRPAVRGMVLFPFLVPAVIAVLAWRWIFSDTVGIANYLLVDVLHLFDKPINWFAPEWAMVSVVVMSLWKYLPYWALFVLARLQTLPPELEEAASVDGANAFQRFRHVTWPWIFPVVMVLLILRTIWAFNEFDMTYLPLHGGPLEMTTTMPVYVRHIAFEIGNMGAAAAVAMAMIVIAAILTNLYMFLYRWAERQLE